MITNRQFRIAARDILNKEALPETIEGVIGRKPLRWYIAGVTAEEYVVEATLDDHMVAEPEDGGKVFYAGRSAVISITPTGVGCALGGYAGDAAPANHLLGTVVDYLVTNPNTVNASNFIHLPSNVLYTEGLCIDLLSKGQVDLHVPYGNRVGLLIERTSPENLEVVFNVVNTARAVYGIDIAGCVVTEEAIGSRAERNSSGAFVGTVDNPQVILDGCRRLQAMGANAIAITTNIQDLPMADYQLHFDGECPNPMGGVEAIMSHLIVNRLGIPAAHAPMINCKDMPLSHPVVDARGAGEMTSQSGLACVLMGLRKAPQIRRQSGGPIADSINRHNLLAVVAPAGCLGGIPTIYADRFGIPIIAVESNETILNVTAQDLNLRGVRRARNYTEAAGILLALKHGISLDSVERPLETLRPEGALSLIHI